MSPPTSTFSVSLIVRDSPALPVLDGSFGTTRVARVRSRWVFSSYPSVVFQATPSNATSKVRVPTPFATPFEARLEISAFSSFFRPAPASSAACIATAAPRRGRRVTRSSRRFAGVGPAAEADPFIFPSDATTPISTGSSSPSFTFIVTRILSAPLRRSVPSKEAFIDMPWLAISAAPDITTLIVSAFLRASSIFLKVASAVSWTRSRHRRAIMRLLGPQRRQGFVQVCDDLPRVRPRPEQAADALLVERRHVLGRDHPSPAKKHVRHLALLHEVEDLGEERHVRAGEN